MLIRANTLPRPLLLLPIALLSALVLWWSTAPSPSTQRLISRWRPDNMLTQPESPAQSPTLPPADALNGVTQPLAGGQFDLSVDDGLYADQREQLAAELDSALAYVSARFGNGPSERFRAAIQIDGGCGLHGIAYTDVRTLQTFTCDGISRDRAVAIMAHEFVHQLEQDRYGAAHLHSDTILAEGAATWGAGKYWLGDTPDFRTYVRNQRRSGVFYPLATDYNGLGIGAMNALYYQWASFVEYLIGAYGREKFDAVYVLGASGIATADYAAVYGKGLDALEGEWQTWIGN
jgi:hypothetical protein